MLLSIYSHMKSTRRWGQTKIVRSTNKKRSAPRNCTANTQNRIIPYGKTHVQHYWILDWLIFFLSRILCKHNVILSLYKSYVCTNAELTHLGRRIEYKCQIRIQYESETEAGVRRKLHLWCTISSICSEKWFIECVVSHQSLPNYCVLDSWSWLRMWLIGRNQFLVTLKKKTQISRGLACFKIQLHTTIAIPSNQFRKKKKHSLFAMLFHSL